MGTSILSRKHLIIKITYYLSIIIVLAILVYLHNIVKSNVYFLSSMYLIFIFDILCWGGEEEGGR